MEQKHRKAKKKKSGTGADGAAPLLYSYLLFLKKEKFGNAKTAERKDSPPQKSRLDKSGGF